MRTKNLLRVASSLPAPPPSPIPTAKGSRSAANSLFSDYLDNSIQIPELNLPEQLHRSVLADIDYQSLKSGDSDALNWLLRSAMQFGAFRISGHGISSEELRSTVTEADSVFGVSSECCRDYGDREEFVWCRSGKATAERVKEVIGAKKYRSFNQKMENIACKLEAIAEELGQIILRNTSKQFRTSIQPYYSKLSLSKHKFFTLEDQSEHSLDRIWEDSCKHALSLHLPVDHGEFCLKSERGILSFHTTPDTIVVTIREQLEEWSHGEFKSAHGKLNYESDHGSQTSFSFELRCWPSNLNFHINNYTKKISVGDQILVVLFLSVVYKILCDICF